MPSIFRTGARDRPEVATDRILTVPNLLSALRIVALPFVFRDLAGGRPTRALVLLVAVVVTDFVDGYVARRFAQVTRFGQLIDPVSDRLVVVVVILGMVVGRILPGWAAAIMLAREGMAVAGGAGLVATGRRPPPVTDLGKSATFGLMTALSVFVLAAAVSSGQLRSAAWVLFAGSTALSYLALGHYAVGLWSGPRR